MYIIHLPRLRTRVRLIRGYEAFKETNFTHVFLFLICDVYVTTLFIKRIKLCLCFEKFYDFFLFNSSFKKKPPHNRRLSPSVSWTMECFIYIYIYIYNSSNLFYAVLDQYSHILADTLVSHLSIVLAVVLHFSFSKIIFCFLA